MSDVKTMEIKVYIDEAKSTGLVTEDTEKALEQIKLVAKLKRR